MATTHSRRFFHDEETKDHRGRPIKKENCHPQVAAYSQRNNETTSYSSFENGALGVPPPSSSQPRAASGLERGDRGDHEPKLIDYAKPQPRIIDYAKPQPRSRYLEHSQRSFRVSAENQPPKPQSKPKNSENAGPKIIDYTDGKPKSRTLNSMVKPHFSISQHSRRRYLGSDQLGGRPSSLHQSSEPSAAKPTKHRSREPFREVASPHNKISGPPPKGATYKFEDMPQHQQLNATMDEEDEKAKFELMNVTIVVYRLSGIVCEKEVISTKKKRSKFILAKDKFPETTKMLDNSARSGRSSIRRGLYSGSTMSSTNASASAEEINPLENPNAPTTAVVSYQKNALGSHTALETFLPSVPLHHPSSSQGCNFRYAATWPSEQQSSAVVERNEKAIEMSSFKLTRCMKQGMFVPGAGAVGSNYVHETLELKLNLSRGTELIRLGTASLVISGEEEGEVQINIPAKPIVQNPKKTNKNRFKNGTKWKAKSNKYGYFGDDPTRRYYLDENATLRVGIQVIPEQTIKFAEEREREDNDLRQILLGSTSNLKQAIDRIGGRQNKKIQTEVKNETIPLHHFGVGFNKNNEPLVLAEGQGVGGVRGADRRCTQPAAQSIFRNLISCGAMFCAAPGAMAPEPKATTLPLEMIHTPDGVLEFGAASLVSSVSESTDGSATDFSDEGEMEEHLNNFHHREKVIIH